MIRTFARAVLAGVSLHLFPVLGAPAPIEAQSATVSLGADTLQEIAPNTAFSLPVNVDNPPNLASLTVRISWDAGAFSYQAYTPGNFGQVVVNESAAGTGSLLISVFSPNGTSSDFTAVSLDFVSGSDGGGLFVDVLAAGNEGGTDISASVFPVDRNLCVGILGLSGDVNADDGVNIIDAQQVGRASVSLPVADPARLARLGDVNTDGHVSVIDAQQLARFSVMLPASPGIGAEVGGCWEELWCGPSGGAISVPQVVVGDTESRPPLSYFVVEVSGSSVDFTMRSPVPWIQLPATSGTTPFNEAASVYGDPSAPQGPMLLPIVATSSQAKIFLQCELQIWVVRPKIFAAPDAVELTAALGGPNPSGHTWVAIYDQGNGIDNTLQTTVGYSQGGAGWLSATIGTPSPATHTVLGLDTDISALPVGRHVAEVTISSPRYSGIAPLVVPVTLTIE